MAIQIDIWYQLTNSDSESHITLSPEAYFDPLDSGDTYVEHGVPRYSFTWQYIDVPRDRLLWSVERRSGMKDATTFSTQYFDGGKSWMNHRSDPCGYEELIHAFDLGETYLTLRSFKQPNGRWVCHTATFRNAKTDDELFSLPDGTFRIAENLSTRLAEIASRD